jgi:branched-chain amino acid transport system ATP-binding protein
VFDATSPPTASEGRPDPPTPAEPPLLHLSGVSKHFGGLPAVDNLSVAVRGGEVLGIIGPNGAGKSTLVNLIGGALAPTAGTVLYQGQDISRLPAHRRAQLGIARTFQVTQPFAGLDVRDNVLVGALFGRQRLRRAAAVRVVDDVLERVGLEHKAALRGDQLTTADRKRLELARALATTPRLLLLDEVMAGLTPTEITQAVALIREINRTGVTVVVIEHIMRAITGVSDRILVMHHGRKIADDEPERVLSDPQVIEAYLGERYAKQRQAQRSAFGVRRSDSPRGTRASAEERTSNAERSTPTEQEGGTASP